MDFVHYMALHLHQSVSWVSYAVIGFAAWIGAEVAGESALLRAGALAAAITFLGAATVGMWRSVSKVVRRSDAIDDVLRTVPKLVDEVERLHEGQARMEKTLDTIKQAAIRRRKDDIGGQG